jgi:hypothetical protein
MRPPSSHSPIDAGGGADRDEVLATIAEAAMAKGALTGTFDR